MWKLSVLAIVVLCAGATWAAEENSGGAISLQFNNADIAQAFTELSQKAQVTILGDSSVKGKVGCSLSDVTVEQALDVICTMNGLTWVRVHAGLAGEEKPSAGKLFKLLDVLKEAGGSALIYEDPVAGTQTVFIPDAKPAPTQVADIASGLKLNTIYLVRAKVDPEAVKAAEKKAGEQKAEQEKLGNFPTPPADPKAAAAQVWGYFSQMPVEQRFQVMGEMRQMLWENLSPEQRENMRRGAFGPDGGRRRPEWGRRPQSAP